MYHETAKGLASLGRGQDSMLVHMTPGEVKGLQQLALSAGGSLTINPHTGLPEAGFLSSLLPMVAAAAGTYFGGPLGGMAAGALTGGITNQQNPLMGAILGGISGYGMSGIGDALSGLGSEAAKEAAAKSLVSEASTNAAAEGLTLPSWYGDAAAKTVAPTAQASMLSGVERLGTGEGWSALKDNLGGWKGTAKTVGMAAAPLALYGLGTLNKQNTLAPGTGAQAAPTQFYNTKYSPGVRNPRFGIPGEPYFLGQGYGPGVYAAEGGLMNASPNAYPGARITQNMEEGGVASFAAGGDTRFAGVDGTFTPAADYYTNLLNTPQQAPQAQAGIGGLNDYLNNLNASFQYTPTTPTASQIQNTNGNGWVYDPATQTFNPAQATTQTTDINPAQVVTPPERTGDAGGFAGGGLADLPEYAAGGKLLRGPGDGMSDSIPAVIKGERPQRAALADGEFVISSDVVSALGSGSTDAGAKRLYQMMDRVRKHAHGTKKQIRPYKDGLLPV